MARPKKKGLDYFPKDVDTWDDIKIMELAERYGPLGYCVYDVVRDEVYRNGYYLEIPIERLALLVVRKIGNRWAKNKDYVMQVIRYCADIGLFDSTLLSQSVVTSAGIQRRYDEVTARNMVDKSKYRLPEVEAAALAAPEKNVSVTESPVSAAKTPFSAAETPPKESKENESKENESKGEERKGEQTEGGCAAPPPSLKEVRDYILSNGYRISAERFFGYYESTGWRRGSTPITDWKSLADIWEQSEWQRPAVSNNRSYSYSDGDDYGVGVKSSSRSTFNVEDLEGFGLL